MPKLGLRLGFAALPLLASALSPADARACGGCFHPVDPPPMTFSQVTAHRMALSISPDASVLWDQVQYAGSPAEFAWVLPVMPGARIEVASDAWFEALDAATTVRVSPPTIQCVTTTSVSQPPFTVYTPGTSYPYRQGAACSVVGPGMAAGCGSSEVGMTEGETMEVFPPPMDVTEISMLAPPPPDPVTVVHQGSAGPYETVTLHANVPGVLPDWLTQHGFAIDADIQPIIDDYAANGFDFIALRLLPDQGVQQMKPVRVIQPGAVTTLPLRMVAAGAGANVTLTLFVIGEGRYRADGYDEATPSDNLTWNFFTQESDYATKRAQSLAGGAAWLTSYAARGGLFSTAVDPTSGTQVQYTTGNGAASTIADAFMKQAFANGETELSCAGIFGTIAQSGDRVVNPCPPGGGECATVAADELDARYLACGPLQDLAVALVGLHPRDVWISRLEAEMPRQALGADLILVPAEQQPVENLLVAKNVSNPPCQVASGAPAAPASPRGSSGGSRRALLVVAGAALLAAAAARRLRRGVAAVAVR
jgi:hypothetical protein